MRRFIFLLIAFLAASAPIGRTLRKDTVDKACVEVTRPPDSDDALFKIANDANKYCLVPSNGLYFSQPSAINRYFQLNLKLSDIGRTTTTTSSNSGLEVTTFGLSMLLGCSDGQVEQWDATNKWWKCVTPAGTGAPTDADYLVKTANGSLSAERVVTDTTSITWDWSTAGQAKAQRAALTGDVTAALNDNATTIANNAVTYAKMQDTSAASVLIGRGSAAGAGDPQEISLGTNISMSGTTLNVSSGANGTLWNSYTSAGDNSYSVPAWAQTLTFHFCGGGGGGGGGRGAAAGSARGGGTGGGGGSCGERIIPASVMASTIHISVGSAGTPGSSGGNGGAGGNTCVSSGANCTGTVYFIQYGGGAGLGQTSTGNVSGASGGGWAGAGNIGSSSSVTGGMPRVTGATTLEDEAFGGGGSNNSNADGNAGFYGGGAGGGAIGNGTTAGKKGGTSMFGGGGGGAGGGVNAASPGTNTAGGEGGNTFLFDLSAASGGGGSAGASGGATPGGNGDPGSFLHGGDGGGGGGSNNAGTGGAGGDGGLCGGGAGGGGGGTSTGGAGGTGGVGCAYVEVR